MGCRSACDPGGASQRIDAHDQFHVGDRPGVVAGHDDRADPGRGTPDRGGKVPDPGDVPDCRGYGVGGCSSGAWRRLPPDRRAASAASRSHNRCEAHLADLLQTRAERRWMQKALLSTCRMSRPQSSHRYDLLLGRTGQQSAPSMAASGAKPEAADLERSFRKAPLAAVRTKANLTAGSDPKRTFESGLCALNA